MENQREQLYRKPSLKEAYQDKLDGVCGTPSGKSVIEAEKAIIDTFRTDIKGGAFETKERMRG